MRAVGLAVLMLVAILHGTDQPDGPVALRMDSFVVTPAHLPPAVVVAKNLRQSPYEGTIHLKLPDGWTCSPAEHSLSLAPGETKSIRFTIAKGRTSELNRYPIEMVAVGGGTTVTRRQDVVCASAPYFAPEIDGRTNEWADAIPVTFPVGGKSTVISTYWSRRQFSLLVAVEEDSWIPFDSAAEDKPCDAVQLAMSPQELDPGLSPVDAATRYEFLFVGTAGASTGRCFQLAAPGLKLSEAARNRTLGSLEFDKAKIVVTREKGVTYYECAIPFRSLEQIKPSEGREFFLSVLVHDPDGTGLRDWGAAAGLFPWERNAQAWTRWPSARWPEAPPFDNKTPWGLCSSKY